MSVPDEIAVEVFRAGSYGSKGVYTEDDLERMAQDYNPADHEAPVTLDHEQKGPAHGWVTKLRRTGDRLVAHLSRISPLLKQALESHAFKKRSVELYRTNPNTGRPYLKAVSFLGAAAPEVKGLADPAFSETATFEEDIVQPRVDVAALAKAQLVAAGAWNPAWEGDGLADVFSALDDEGVREKLVAVLSRSQAPVSFGRTETDAASVANFADTLVGGASAESRARHLKAIGILNEQPTLTYSEALLLVH